MTNISASQVKALRNLTSVSMGDCKKALVEAGGDQTKAVEILNRKYAGQLGKRADKITAEGRIGGYADGDVGALVELRCETDFVAISADFKSAADAIAAVVAQSGVTDVEGLQQASGTNGRATKDILAESYGKLKENIQLARAARIEGGAAFYVHHNGRRGSVLAATGTGGDAARNICLHIAAQPLLLGLDRDAVEPGEVSKARELMADQAKGKPPNIAEKIVTGKMDKWFGERVLLEQPLAMDDKQTVGEVAQKACITISGYLKFELGE